MSLPRFFRAALLVTVWLNLLVLIAAVLVINFTGDVTWWGSVLLYGPRWPWLIPAAVAFLAALVIGRPSAWFAGLFSWTIALFCMLGICLGWIGVWNRMPIFGSVDPAASLCIVTFNCDGSRADLAAFFDYAAQVGADAIVMQESPFAVEDQASEDWHIDRVGPLVVLSKYPLHRLEILEREDHRGEPHPFAALYQVEYPSGPVMLVNVHILSPRFGLMRMTDRRTLIAPGRHELWQQETHQRWSEHAQLRSALQKYDLPRIVAGDFNVPPDSWLYHRHWCDYRNAFSRAGWGRGLTVNIEHHGWSLWARIDHILFDHHWHVRRSHVGPQMGSGHLPVMGQLRRR